MSAWQPIMGADVDNLIARVPEVAAFYAQGYKICMDVTLIVGSKLQPDWSQAPEWANWWACDPAGWTCWYQEEPVMYLTDNYSGWVVKTINGNQQCLDLEAQSIDIPLGIDWRTLKVARP